MRTKNYNNDIIREYIECDCGTKAHMAVVEYDTEMGLTLHYQHREWRGFWKRLWTAVKYVFQLGWEHDMGWDCTMMSKENCDQMQKMLDLVRANGHGTFWDNLPKKPLIDQGEAKTDSTAAKNVIDYLAPLPPPSK